jgi:hypothetical protein
MLGVSGHFVDKRVDSMSMSQGLSDIKNKCVNLHEIAKKS